MEKSTSSKEIFPLLKIIFTFFSIVVIRIFLDGFAYPNSDGFFYPSARLLQVVLYFFSIFLSFSILTYIFSKKSFDQILSFMLKVFLFILIVPIADLILHGPETNALKYLMKNPSELFETFFKIMHPFSGQGITFGQHLAAYGIIFCIAFFIYKSTKNFFKSFLSLFFGYAVLFVYAILPSIIVFLSNGSNNNRADVSTQYGLLVGSSWIYQSLEKSDFFTAIFSQSLIAHEIVMAQLFFVTLSLQVLFIFSVSSKKNWDAFKIDLRITRIFYWLIIAGIGIVLSKHISGDINLQNPINILSLLAFAIIIIFNIWLAVFINDAEDIEIDKISNTERPLIKKTISLYEWDLMQTIVLLLIIFGTATMNRATASLLVVAQAAYYIYSAQPLRLKRHFFSSSILTGLAAVFIAMAGFFLVSPDQHLSVFPLKAFFIIGLSYAALSNLKDIKDFLGDKQEGIRTIPVVFGLENSKKIIALMVAIVIIAIPIILNVRIMALPSIAIAAFLFYLFTKKEYQEKYIFLVFFLYMTTFFLVTL